MVRQEGPGVDGHRAGRDQPRLAAAAGSPIADIAEDGAPLEPPPHAMVEDPRGVEARAARHGRDSSPT